MHTHKQLNTHRCTNAHTQMYKHAHTYSHANTQVYKYKDTFAGGQIKVEVYISFGGLLMLLVGDPKKLQDLEVDSSVYLLVRKV